MSVLSTYLANHLLDHTMRGATGGTSFSQPGALYAALSSTTPNPDGTNVTEPSGFSYARVNTYSGFWTASASSMIANGSAQINWPTATGNWGTITYVCIYDASSSGNLLWSGQLAVSKPITNGDTFSIPVSDISLTLT